METCVRKTLHELNLAGRKAGEAALRRYQATEWLESLVGPLGISKQPNEREFISCLRSGLVLCNAINKIQSGSVQKVVENHLPSESSTWDSQPLPAYQYFENVRNFLVAAEKLKLTTFEAPVLERDNLEAGSSAKVVDCILELKVLHEGKQRGGGNVSFKPQRSPFAMHSVGKIHSRVLEETSSDPHRRLDMTTSCNKKTFSECETQELEDFIVATLAECMVDKKENIDANLLVSFRNENPAAINLLRQTMSSCLEEQVQNMLEEVKPALVNCSGGESSSITTLMENSSVLGNGKCCRACLNKGYCNHHMLFKMQENELLKIKSLLSRTKEEFEDLQSQLQTDMKQLESHVKDMSTAALGYHKVVKENIKLHSKVQNLKGLEKTLAIADVSAEEMELRKELQSLKKALSNRKLQSSEVNVLKENRSPSDKSKLMTNQTPLRPRRLSIEASSTIRREKAQLNKPKETKSLLPGASAEITPPARGLNTENHYTPMIKKSPRVRRLSIGTSSVVKLEKETGPKETNHVSEKAQANAERTPRPRRLSIENCSSTIRREKAPSNKPKETKSLLPGVSAEITPPARGLNTENHYTPMIKKSPRVRRLSIGTPSVVKLEKETGPKETNHVSEKAQANAERTPRPRRLSIENCSTTKKGKTTYLEDKKVIKTPSVQTRTKRLSLEGPRCSERPGLPQEASKPNTFPNHVDSTLDISCQMAPKGTINAVYCNQVEPLELQTTSTRATAHGKESNIRKSLRAIGKLINGSEKRNQHKQKDTPVIATDGNMKSPVTHNARMLRRQSLSGTQSPVMSSTTSVGMISDGFRSSCAITPPPVRASAKSPKRWL